MEGWKFFCKPLHRDRFSGAILAFSKTQVTQILFSSLVSALTKSIEL